MPPTAWIVRNLWLIPALPVLAAGCIALLTQKRRALAAGLAIGSMFVSFLLAICAFSHMMLLRSQGIYHQVFNFHWLQFGHQWLSLGWLLDPITALMLLMVTFVGLLIFIFSVGYMSHDENFTRFFCFLALFAGAMLGVLIANNLLLLFMCWEVVGLTSYLLIGFWFTNPNAAAAAKKAFIVTRIGDLGFLLGMVWLYAQSGTLLFYDGGAGAIEPKAIATLLSHNTIWGLTVASAIALLIFCGAAGKSGQVPLHVWLPDAMEGPTPVSALIHAATMVAAGVFLVARMYPLMSAQISALASTPSVALQVVTWVGAVTALFGALIAVAQFDIKRILAYSTISQLGYMMMGLGAGGVAVGMFHLLTHAFFKALLFLGAGSIIHGCSGEQDIRFMGGLRKRMPITFATYTAGMLALCGFPLLFSGFWSKDEILFSAHSWEISQIPFYMGAFAALLTAFYMTRQMFYVFAGTHRTAPHSHEAHVEDASSPSLHHPPAGPHESPSVMLVPLVLLATFAVFLGFFGTPAWPWLQSFIEGAPVSFSLSGFSTPGLIAVMLSSSAIVLTGLTLGWWVYGRKAISDSSAHDPLAQAQPAIFATLANAFYVDAFYRATFVRAANVLAALSAWFDRWVWNGVVQAVSMLVLGFGHFDSFLDTHLVNTTFDEGCRGVSGSARLLARLQNGRVQLYLRYVAAACILFVVLLLWRATR